MFRNTLLNFAALALFTSSVFVACGPAGSGEDSQAPNQPRVPQQWLVSLDIPGTDLPFVLEEDWDNPGELLIRNGAEELSTGLVEVEGDSVTIPLNIFRSYIRYARLDREGGGKGYWHRESRGDYRIPLTITENPERRFHGAIKAGLEPWLGQDWKVWFIADGDSSLALGRFEAADHVQTASASDVVGTFLTPTGDYRFLEGDLVGDSLYLSCFDGSHAFLFTAGLTAEGDLAGEFRSGKHWREDWTASRDPEFCLPDPDSLTQMRAGENQLDFCFPDLDGTELCLADSRWKDKVLLVQVMGSWCPNCMDETSFYREMYDQYHDQGLEIISLAYEAGRSPDSWRKGVSRLVDHFEIPWPVLLAGPASKSEASASLPQLTDITSFPTSIFIDRDGRVVRIHTGFTGPATGEDYRKFVARFHETMESLL